MKGDHLFHESTWFRALTLNERLLLSSPARRMTEDCTTAERLLNEWRSQSPFEEQEWFSRRLRFDGLDEEQFLWLLGESDISLQSRYPDIPDWLRRLAAAFSGKYELSQSVVPEEPAAFSVIVQPLIQQSFEHVLAGARELAHECPQVPFKPSDAARILFVGLTNRLDWMLSRSVVLEMHISKLRGHLREPTREARFQEFMDRHRTPEGAIAFLREYPVLARLVIEKLSLWEKSSLELLSHLCADWRLICSTFSKAEDTWGLLEEVSGGLGDSHRGGRAVRVLRFESGERIVYKPRSLKVDRCFREILGSLHERGAVYIRTPKVLDRGTHGWSEFVAAQPCAHRDDLKRFYYRQGSLLALLYVLNAHDFHRENLVAAGDQPVLIDLETLCGADYGRGELAMYESVAAFELANSVVRVMLLPYLEKGKDRNVLEPSGIGGEEDQLALYGTPQWEDKETDEMRLIRKRQLIAPSSNKPTLLGEYVDPLGFSEELVSGFRAMYRLLIRHREDLLSRGSLLERFASAEVRVLFRDTEFYGIIRRESLHPDLLRNALDRDRHFDRLWFGMDRSRFTELSTRLIAFEKADLWRGDIPYFSTQVDCHDIRASDGQLLPNLLIRTGLEVARNRLGKLNEEDLKEQIWYIRGSFAALAMGEERELPHYVLTREPASSGRDQLLAAASAVGDRLQELARVQDGEASWVGLAPMQRGWQLRSLDMDFYSGLPGVAFSLAYLGKFLERPDLRELSEAALATLRRQSERRERFLNLLGGYMGWGGLLHTWLHLAYLWESDRLLSEALGMLPKISSAVDHDENLDIVFGSAGCIPPLLGLHRATGSAFALDIAQQMGDRIVDLARPIRGGVGWISIEPRHPLAGFSHGACGIAWGLLNLFLATGDERYRKTTIEALDFEDSLFDPAAGNWLDLRGIGDPKKGEGDHRFMAAWCHGSGGIGLSRLRMLHHLDKAHLNRDLEAALETTLRYGFGSNHCLCHGDLGSLDLLLEASLALQNPRWVAEVERMTSCVMASISEHGWRCGVPKAMETPGLMEGLAGIGYELLRVANPADVPSVLLLDPPFSGATVEEREVEKETVDGRLSDHFA